MGAAVLPLATLGTIETGEAFLGPVGWGLMIVTAVGAAALYEGGFFDTSAANTAEGTAQTGLAPATAVSTSPFFGDWGGGGTGSDDDDDDLGDDGPGLLLPVGVGVAAGAAAGAAGGYAAGSSGSASAALHDAGTALKGFVGGMPAWGYGVLLLLILLVFAYVTREVVG